MKEFYVSIKNSLGINVYAEKIEHQKSYYDFYKDVYVVFKKKDTTVVRIPQRIIQEIKEIPIFGESKTIYKSK